MSRSILHSSIRIPNSIRPSRIHPSWRGCGIRFYVLVHILTRIRRSFGCESTRYPGACRDEKVDTNREFFFPRKPTRFGSIVVGRKSAPGQTETSEYSSRRHPDRRARQARSRPSRSAGLGTDQNGNGFSRLRRRRRVVRWRRWRRRHARIVVLIERNRFDPVVRAGEGVTRRPAG